MNHDGNRNFGSNLFCTLLLLCFRQQIYLHYCTSDTICIDVYVNDTVTFECATNETGYSIFIFNGGAPPPSQTSVTLPNGGKMISFNLTATYASNGTDVTCITFNETATESAYLYVQVSVI